MVRSGWNNMTMQYNEEYDQFLNKDTLGDLNKWKITNVNSDSLVSDWGIDLKQTKISTIYNKEDIKSEDYVAWYSGWIIKWNWDAEFNAGTFRWLLTSSSIAIPNATSPLFSVDTQWNVVANSLRRNDFHWFTPFEWLSGYYVSNWWIWTTVVQDGWLFITSWATTWDKTTVRKSITWWTSWDYNKSFRCLATFWSNTNQDIFISTWDLNPSSDRNFWFHLFDWALYWEVWSWTSLWEVDLSVSVSIWSWYKLEAILDVDLWVVSFYVNDVLKWVSESDVPTWSSWSDWLFDTTFTNQSTLDWSKTLQISWFDFWQAN